MGQVMTVSGITSLDNAFHLLFLGQPDDQPKSLGSMVPMGDAYLDLSKYFMLVGIYGGKKFSTGIPIPNATSIQGLGAMLQTFALDALRFPAGMESSAGVHLHVGL
jgi:hypothetical protein